MLTNVWLSSSRFRRLSQILSLGVLAISILTFADWLVNIAVQPTIVKGLSALSFAMTSLAILLLSTRQERTTTRTLARLVAAITLLSLTEAVFRIDLEFQHLLFPGQPAIPTALIAPNVATALLLLALSMLLFDARSPGWVCLGQLFAAGAGLIAGVAITGHLYQLPSLYQLGNNPPMSISASVIVVLLAVSIFTAGLDRGLTTIFIRSTMGGTMARGLLPLAVLVPIILTLIQVTLGRLGLYTDESDVVVFASFSTIVMMSIIWWNAGKLDEQEQARKRAENALQASEKRYRAIFENSSDALLIFDAEGRYLDANPQAERLTGYSLSEITTKRVGDFALLPSAGKAAFEEVQRTEQLNIDYVLARKDGSYVDVEFIVTKVAPGIYQTILHDISDHKRVEGNLRRSLEQERQLNELKSRFVSMVSHDFRTPLAVIQSSADLLMAYSDRIEPAKRRARLVKIQNQVSHLVELLDDILVIGQGESIGSNFEPETTDLRAFCISIIADIQPAIATHRIEFSASSDCPPIPVDPKLMRRAVINLITNAVKYSPDSDCVQIDLDHRDSDVFLRVKDNGIGIPEADQARLFETFHRASNVGSIRGTGLGLPIVKQVVDAHGGQLACDSRENEGTTFTITLPCYRA